MSDPKSYTPADVQLALKERLKKFETQLQDLHARELKKDEHMEPGIHEANMGQQPHLEGGPGPGGHEMAAMPMPQSQPEQPVGSSSDIPPGQLQDLCPMCGQPDMPGQCTCLNGGGHEAMDPGLSQLANSVPATPMALSEDSMEPMAMSEKLCKLHKAALCNTCMSKATDFINIDGKKKTKGIHPDAKLPPGDDQVLPQKSKSKEVSSADDNDPKKNGLGKAADPMSKVGPPMAKPPGGGTGLAPKAPAVAKPVVPKVGAPGAAPKAPGLGKAAMPMDHKAMAQSHANIIGSLHAKGPGAGAAPKAMPSPTQHANRAASFGAAAAGDFQPKGPVHSGLELAPKKLAAPGRLIGKGEASASVPEQHKAKIKAQDAKMPKQMKDVMSPVKIKVQPDAERKSELSKSMGACLFCGNGEHAGDCGLAKNIHSSMLKALGAVSGREITIAPPKLKPAAAGMGHVGGGGAEKTMATNVGEPTKAGRPASLAAVKSEETATKKKPTHVCAAPLCTKGISGNSEFCKNHKPKGK